MTRSGREFRTGRCVSLLNTSHAQPFQNFMKYLIITGLLALTITTHAEIPLEPGDLGYKSQQTLQTELIKAQKEANRIAQEQLDTLNSIRSRALLKEAFEKKHHDQDCD